MPGGLYYEGQGGQINVPFITRYLAANSMTGAGTPPANAIQYGDVLCLTTAAALTASSQVVCRMLLAADVAALYQDGSTNVCGVLGVAIASGQYNATGVATAPPALGGITTNAAINYPLSDSGLEAPDPATGRSFIRVSTFVPGRQFLFRLYTGGGSVTLTNQYTDTLAGFALSTTSGITTFTINPAATTKCLRIIGPDTADPLYNTLVAQNATGPGVIIEVLPAFSQYNLGFNYSAQ